MTHHTLSNPSFRECKILGTMQNHFPEETILQVYIAPPPSNSYIHLLVQLLGKELLPQNYRPFVHYHALPFVQNRYSIIFANMQSCSIDCLDSGCFAVLCLWMLLHSLSSLPRLVSTTPLLYVLCVFMIVYLTWHA